mmetsp:Transcript_14360/g.25827  ORF Transcript_14360/g.25827 Transcript_14360/m.25827 type:complete len:157 (+) Transcript_14360:39-509(+)
MAALAPSAKAAAPPPALILLLLACVAPTFAVEKSSSSNKAQGPTVYPPTYPGWNPIPPATINTGYEGKAAARPGPMELLKMSNEIATQQAAIDGEIAQANAMSVANGNYIRRHKEHIQRLRDRFDAQKTSAVKKIAQAADALGSITAPRSLSQPMA